MDRILAEQAQQPLPLQKLLCPLCASMVEPAGLLVFHKRDYVLCPTCDLLFMSPAFRLREAEERVRYQLHQNDAADAGYLAFLDNLRQPVLSELKKRFNAPRGKAAPALPRGLDFGSGPYPMLAQLMAAEGYPLSCWDPYFSERPKTALLQEAPWDYILCCEVAEHFYYPDKEFAFLRSVLAPGGFIAIMTSLRPLTAQLSAWSYLSDSTHVSLYSRCSFEWLARALGLRLSFPAERVVFLSAD